MTTTAELLKTRTVGVCLLGHGIVGSGVVKILTQQREMLRQRTGLNFQIRHVIVRDPTRHSTLAGQLREATISVDATAAIDDPQTQVVLELMGGTTTAADCIQRALKLGKPVITANKSLLSTRGAELFALAKTYKTCIGFEASCGGGVPIVQSLIKGLAANRIDALVGIVNGTCNFILTQMTRLGWTYDAALAEAQKAGFAEADPALDVSGRDAAQKLALLASLAFNVRLGDGEISTEGIDRLQQTDIALAGEMGYVIKLLAIAERAGGSGDSADYLIARVHPTLVHKDDVLAEVGGSFNAISVFGHALGHALFYGRGAGQMPTASAVVSDLIGVALGSTLIEFSNLRIFPDTSPAARLLPFEQLQSRYYLRLSAKDEPGVLAQIALALGQHGISLSAIHQHETDQGQLVPVVITTHLANEGAMQAALRQINALSSIAPPAVLIRIIDQPREFAR